MARTATINLNMSSIIVLLVVIVATSFGRAF